jgi:hypothetical protein
MFPNHSGVRFALDAETGMTVARRPRDRLTTGNSAISPIKLDPRPEALRPRLAAGLPLTCGRSEAGNFPADKVSAQTYVAILRRSIYRGYLAAGRSEEESAFRGIFCLGSGLNLNLQRPVATLSSRGFLNLRAVRQQRSFQISKNFCVGRKFRQRICVEGHKKCVAIWRQSAIRRRSAHPGVIPTVVHSKVLCTSAAM